MNDSFEVDSKQSTLNHSVIPSKVSILSIKCFALIFGVISIAGPVYIYIMIQAVKTQLESLFNIDDGDYNLIYSVGGIPPLFMPIVGGYLTDYLGAGTTFLATFISEIVMTYACSLQNFPVFMIGNLIYSSMLDTLYLSRVKLITTMFYEKYMSLAIGVAVIFQKSSMLASNIVSPWVYDKTQSLTKTWLVAVSLCIASFVSGVIFVSLNKKFRLSDNVTTVQNEVKRKMKWSDIKKISTIL